MLVFLQQLEKSLNEFGHSWHLNPGDGAFYGPKVGDSYSSPLPSSLYSFTALIPLTHPLTHYSFLELRLILK